MSSRALLDRATISNEKGFNCLLHACQHVAQIHRIYTNRVVPEKNSSLGVTSFPCSSFSLFILHVASIVAIAIHKLFSAMNRPGHILSPNTQRNTRGTKERGIPRAKSERSGEQRFPITSLILRPVSVWVERIWVFVHIGIDPHRPDVCKY